MFCPNCKVEYRRGFRECSDCHVDLVDSLPPENSPASASGGDAKAPELLWSGYNRSLRDQIGVALDAADIPYADESREVNWLPALEQRAPYEIWILRADHDSAAKILAESFPEVADGPDSADVNELADSSDQAANEIPANDLPPENHPDDATCEVWSGDDDHAAQFLRDCLRGVGIACVVSQDDAKARVLVLPAAEIRAREIVREVIEGAPPE
ncbi:MAG: hypothetical protein WB559_05400 [Candidatus Acidiferrales bacterium]